MGICLIFKCQPFPWVCKSRRRPGFIPWMCPTLCLAHGRRCTNTCGGRNKLITSLRKEVGRGKREHLKKPRWKHSATRISNSMCNSGRIRGPKPSAKKHKPVRLGSGILICKMSCGLNMGLGPQKDCFRKLCKARKITRKSQAPHLVGGASFLMHNVLPPEE